MTLFGIDMAGEIAAGFDGLLMAGTLIKMVPSGTLDGHGDPVLTPTPYAAQGFFDTYSAITLIAAGIPITDVRIMLLAGSCAVAPAVQDKVQMNGGTYQIKNIAIDPAGAVYDMQCSKVPS